MNKELEQVIIEVQHKRIDPEPIKYYIELIRRYLRDSYERCKEDASIEDILEEFKAEHAKDIEFIKREEALPEYIDLYVYEALKRLIKYKKSDEHKFNGIISRGKKNAYNTEPGERMKHSADIDEEMQIMVQRIVMGLARTKEPKQKVTTEEIMSVVSKNKADLEEKLKASKIDRIEYYTSFLYHYGLIEDRIDEINKELKKINPNLMLKLRNPLGMKTDSKGNILQGKEKGYIYNEDAGVLDLYDKHYLKFVSVEDLTLMEAFFKDLYTDTIVGLNEVYNITIVSKCQ